MNATGFFKIGYFVLLLSLSACFGDGFYDSIRGRGDISYGTMALDSFTEVEIANQCNVEIVQGSSFKVEYSDYENIISHLAFEVEGNRLVIKTLPAGASVRNSRAYAKVYVAGPLALLRISGSGNMEVQDAFPDLSIFSITGSGNIALVAPAAVTSVNANISGSGNIDIRQQTAANAECTISGSGNITVSVTGFLNAFISGSGNVRYLGTPTITQTITGSGVVEPL